MAITRLLFGTDFHGSEVCFRKFLGAASAYQANVVVVGGDITGKAIVPIAKASGGYQAHLFGEEILVHTEAELTELRKRISAVGFYPYVAEQDELDELRRDQTKMDRLFMTLMNERVRGWVELAEVHVVKKGMRCFMMPGNDDMFCIDEILNLSKTVNNSDGKIVQLDEYHEMVTVGYNNITPWQCHRDISEEELFERIDATASGLENPGGAIFNLHCPPQATNLDQAPEIDANLRIVYHGGQISMKSAGSTAVRRAIEKYHPLLGLHGHIHEGRGFDRIGTTLCLNPGSEYAEGIMRAAIVNLEKNRVKGYILISG
mgnify:CR=1 FL=1